MKRGIFATATLIAMVLGLWCLAPISGPQLASSSFIPSSYLDTDGTLAANSDAKVPSQKAVKTYVDANAGGAAKSILFSCNTTLGGQTSPASTTSYIRFGSGLFVAAESDAVLVIPCNGTAKNLYVRTGTTGGGGGESTPVTTITIRKNGVDTAITLTMAQDTETVSSDTTHSVAFSAGDTISISVTTDSAGSSAGITSISLEFDPS